MNWNPFGSDDDTDDNKPKSSVDHFSDSVRGSIYGSDDKKDEKDEKENEKDD
jgi:hypothetical protein